MLIQRMMKAWKGWKAKHVKNSININVQNVDASTWFIFCGSYLGGTMTLAGMMVTLKHERGIHQYEKALKAIEKEKDGLGKAIGELNLFIASALYHRFNSLLIAS